jgi:hypothetical protein
VLDYSGGGGAAPDPPDVAIDDTAGMLLVARGTVAGETLSVVLLPSGMTNSRTAYYDTGDVETAVTRLAFDIYDDGKWRVELSDPLWAGQNTQRKGTFTGISGLGFSGTLTIDEDGVSAPAGILTPSSGGGSPAAPVVVIGVVSGGGSPVSPVPVLAFAGAAGTQVAPPMIIEPPGGWPGTLTLGGADLTLGGEDLTLEPAI